jgi:hypothetical protein
MRRWRVAPDDNASNSRRALIGVLTFVGLVAIFVLVGALLYLVVATLISWIREIPFGDAS